MMIEQEMIPGQELSIEQVMEQAASAKGDDELGRIMQLVVFKLGDEEYALTIDQIKEVVITPGIAKVPHTETFIRGVANIRGTIIAILDLEKKFELASLSPTTTYVYTLVIESETHKVGILVREVPKTLSVRETQIDRSSSIIQYSAMDDDCIDGIVKVEDRLIILVNIHHILKTEDLATVNF